MKDLMFYKVLKKNKFLVLKRVKNGPREKIMGPGTSMRSKEYKKVGLVGNVAIKKNSIFYQSEKKHKFRGNFFWPKFILQTK